MTHMPAQKETAQRIRVALRAAFPETRFSVRVGARTDIAVAWTGGPSKEEVSRVANEHTDIIEQGTLTGWAVIRASREMTDAESEAWRAEREEKARQQSERREAMERGRDEFHALLEEQSECTEADGRKVLEQRMQELSAVLDELEQAERAEAETARWSRANQMVRS